MKVLCQWATRQPRDWQELDSAAWLTLPRKPFVTGGTVTGGARLDTAAGWCVGLCVQGIVWEADHVAVEEVQLSWEGGPPEPAVRVSGWDDDPNASPPAEFQAVVWELFTPAPNGVGVMNTRQRRTVYAGAARFPLWEPTQAIGTVLHPWADWVPPLPQRTRHGLLLSEREWRAHQEARATRGWEDWLPGR